jgi:hypothetical protein
MDGYSGDLDLKNYAVPDNTGTQWDYFTYSFKNLRFNVPMQQQVQLTAADAANLPGLAYRYFGDTSWWRVIMAFNGWSDPLSQVAAGAICNLPSKSAVLQYLSSQQQQQSTATTIMI